MTRIRLSAHPLPGLALVEQARRARQTSADRTAARHPADGRGEYAEAKPEGASRTARARAAAA